MDQTSGTFIGCQVRDGIAQLSLKQLAQQGRGVAIDVEQLAQRCGVVAIDVEQLA